MRRICFVAVGVYPDTGRGHNLATPYPSSFFICRKPCKCHSTVAAKHRAADHLPALTASLPAILLD